MKKINLERVGALLDVAVLTIRQSLLITANTEEYAISEIIYVLDVLINAEADDIALNDFETRFDTLAITADRAVNV